MTFIPFPGQPSVPPTLEHGLLAELDRAGAGRRRVRARGELDIATAPLLAGALDRAADGHGEVELDLSELSFCDVVGLTAIEQAHRRLAARGCRLVLHGTEGLHLLLGVPGLFDIPHATDTASLPRLEPGGATAGPTPDARPGRSAGIAEIPTASTVKIAE